MELNCSKEYETTLVILLLFGVTLGIKPAEAPVVETVEMCVDDNGELMAEMSANGTARQPLDGIIS